MTFDLFNDDEYLNGTYTENYNFFPVELAFYTTPTKKTSGRVLFVQLKAKTYTRFLIDNMEELKRVPTSHSIKVSNKDFDKLQLLFNAGLYSRV